jgi:hypothetical protein
VNGPDPVPSPPWRFLHARNPTPCSRLIAAWNLTLSGKAVEGYRTPRRVAFSGAQRVRQVLDCASPLCFFHELSAALFSMRSMDFQVRQSYRRRLRQRLCWHISFRPSSQPSSHTLSTRNPNGTRRGSWLDGCRPCCWALKTSSKPQTRGSVHSMPCASATARQVKRPSCTQMPGSKPGWTRHAPARPLSAMDSMNGRVALIKAWVAVLA